MATTTTYYGFTKPATGEAVDITVINGTFDTIDSQLHTWAGVIGSVVNRVIYNYTSSTYPVRPTGVAAGFVEWIGPVEPTGAAITGSGAGWLDGDTWVDNS